MSNLTERLDEIEVLSAAQHTALMLRLADTNAKLDSIATALGAPPPTATTSLADVITAINTTNGTLADIHLDTISIDQKLLRIRDAISPIGEAFPTGERSGILWSLYRLMDAVQPTWPRPTSIPVQPAIDLLYGLAVQQTPDIEAIRAALGVPTGDATSTALGLLSAIQFASANLVTSMGMSTGAPNTVLDKLGLLADCGCSSTVPKITDCSAPFNSDGMIVTPPLTVLGLGGALIFATFPDPLPVGITFGSAFGFSTDYSELIADDWTEWAVYVGSDGATQYADQFNQVRYPTNSWRTMVGSGSRGFFVNDSGNITVQLCRVANRDTYVPPAVTFVEYVSVTDTSDWYNEGILINLLEDDWIEMVSVSGSFRAGMAFWGWPLVTGKQYCELTPSISRIGPFHAGQYRAFMGEQYGTCTFRVYTGGIPDILTAPAVLA